MIQPAAARRKTARQANTESKPARCRKLRASVRESLLTLSAYISLAGLERLLLLSHGYLCRLKAQGGAPSPQLAILLDLIATTNPPSLLIEIAQRQGAVIKLKPPAEASQMSDELAPPAPRPR